MIKYSRKNFRNKNYTKIRPKIMYPTVHRRDAGVLLCGVPLPGIRAAQYHGPGLFRLRPFRDSGGSSDQRASAVPESSLRRREPGHHTAEEGDRGAQ